MAQVVESLPHGRQELVYSTQAELLVLTWRQKRPGHQQPRYWSSSSRTALAPEVTNPCLSGKLWYLQHNCVGDTIVLPLRQRYICRAHTSNSCSQAKSETIFWISTAFLTLLVLQTGKLQEDQLNTMPADALAPCVTVTTVNIHIPPYTFCTSSMCMYCVMIYP